MDLFWPPLPPGRCGKFHTFFYDFFQPSPQSGGEDHHLHQHWRQPDSSAGAGPRHTLPAGPRREQGAVRPLQPPLCDNPPPRPLLQPLTELMKVINIKWRSIILGLHLIWIVSDVDHRVSGYSPEHLKISSAPTEQTAHVSLLGLFNLWIVIVILFVVTGGRQYLAIINKVLHYALK